MKDDVKPETFNADLAALPGKLERLVKEPRWVNWRWERKRDEKTGKLSNDWTKVPYQPQAPSRKAENDNPSTWGAYEQALATFKKGTVDGIGYNLLDGDKGEHQTKGRSIPKLDRGNFRYE